MNLEERFWAKVEKTDTCWNWTAQLISGGYGHFRVGSKKILAHRFSYRLLKGSLDPSLTIDHLCRNRKCVNPDHLEQVTMRVNILRGKGITARLARQTHCKRGHELSKENTYIKKNGARECRICSRESKRKYKLKMKDSSFNY